MTDFTFPAEMLGQHLAIVGRVGSGKTYTAKGFVESLLQEKRRVCILDPTGVWYGLRSTADGKKAGFPVAVFGGAHADVPISDQSGSALAKILASRNLPAIVDLSEMLIGQRHRFVTDFAEALYRDNRAPLHLVIDEADEFAPQNPLPETKRMLHQVDRIVRRGRVRGFRVALITQRPAVLHKNVLTQANTLIAMRLTAPQDRKAVQDWVEGQADRAQAKAVLESLARLAQGEGWVWAPELDFLERVRFPKIATFDSSRTPGDDQVATEPTKLAAVDLTEIKESFAAVEQELQTVPQLRAEVADLRRRLAAAEKRTAGAGVPEAEVQRRINEAVGTAAAALPQSADSTRLLAEVRALAGHIINAIDGKVAIPSGKRPVEVTRAPRQREATPAPAAPASATVHGDLKAPEQRIVDAIAWWSAAGVPSPTRHQVAFVAGYTVNGHFNNQCGTLRARGIVDYPGGGALSLLPAGAALANAPYEAPSRAVLLGRVLGVLKGEPMRRIFSILADRGTMSREDLAAAAGYTVNGHFNNIVGALNGIGVAEYPSKGFVGLPSIFTGLEA